MFPISRQYHSICRSKIKIFQKQHRSSTRHLHLHPTNPPIALPFTLPSFTLHFPSIPISRNTNLPTPFLTIVHHPTAYVAKISSRKQHTASQQPYERLATRSMNENVRRIRRRIVVEKASRLLHRKGLPSIPK